MQKREDRPSRRLLIDKVRPKTVHLRHLLREIPPRQRHVWQYLCLPGSADECRKRLFDQRQVLRSDDPARQRKLNNILGPLYGKPVLSS